MDDRENRYPEWPRLLYLLPGDVNGEERENGSLYYSFGIREDWKTFENSSGQSPA
jgi:hypothetical protein